MSNKMVAAAISMAVVTAGCAVQPVPEDVAGVSTYDIARQVRCEAREAVIDAVANWLTIASTVSDKSRAIGFQLRSRELPLDSFSPSMLAPPERAILSVFWNTGVGYDYVLEAEERNNVGAEVNLLKVFTGSAGTLGLKSGFDRTRGNTRTFTITDTFAKLVRDIPPRYCEKHVAVENLIYPMAGKVGIDKVLRDFVHLTLFANLAPPTAAKAPEGPPTYVVELNFETTISGSAAPKIVFSPVRSVSDASLSGLVQRKDIHKLTLGLAVAKGDLGLVGPVRAAFFSGPFLTARPSTRSEAAAVTAISEFKAANIFNKRITIVAP